MKMKGLGKLICLGTKILKIGPKLRELWPYGVIFLKYSMQTSSQGWFTPEWGCVMVISIGSSGYFVCQGKNDTV